MKILSNEFTTAKITGVGKYEENSDYVDSSTPNLKRDAVYLILPQVAHIQPRTVSNPNGTTKEVLSNRFGAIEFINGNVSGFVSVGVTALRAYYLSDDEYHLPKVQMEVRQEGRAIGLYRPIHGQDFHVPTLDKPAPIEVRQDDTKTIVMTKPFAFKVAGRKNYWQLIFQEEPDGRFNMLIDDNMNAKVQLCRDYVLEITEIPAGHYDLKSYIPQLANYAL